jgi:transposase
LRLERQYKVDAPHGMAGPKGGGVAETFEWFVGVDWGSAAHQVCLLNAEGRISGTRLVEHTAAAVHEAVRWIGDRTGVSPGAIAVGIETSSGVLVDALVEHGFVVFALNPKQLDRFRDRFTAAGAKDDDRDAHVVADALRTDRRAFRRVRPDDPCTIQLREVSRLREELMEEEGRLVNRLREQLYRVDAAWLTLSPAADEPWLWRLLADVPDPTRWGQLARRRIRAALHTHRIRRLAVDEVMHALRQPRLPVAEGVTEAVGFRIQTLVRQLLLLRDQRTQSERQMDRLLERFATAPPTEGEAREHRDVEILQSLPGVGRIVTATMLTEATGPLADRDYGTLRAYGGAAPVTKRSGKRMFFVQMRYACKRRVRTALYNWSRVSIQHDAPARTYYDALRARGHSHARALRSVADRWLRILVAMLKSGQLYDPSRFTQLAATSA